MTKSYTYARTAAENPELMDEAIGELAVAEYVVFLLAYDTYMRWLEETHGVELDDVESAEEALLAKGLRLLRIIETTQIEVIAQNIRKDLSTDTQRTLLEKAMRNRVSLSGTARRALQLRTVMSRGGATTMRSIFQTNKALQMVRVAITASMIDEAAKALDKFDAIVLRNKKIQDWIDEASKFAAAGVVSKNPTAAGAQQAIDNARPLMVETALQNGASPTSQEAANASQKRDDIVQQIEEDAREAAAKALAVTGQEDKPMTRSEVVGAATAAAVAVMTDSANPQNIPPSLQGPVGNDPEQLAAALTSGQVLVAAGAGAGKSTTLVARMKYLIRDCHVSPGSIMAVTFNTKAAKELRAKAEQELGADATGVTIGTMHSTFLNFITGGGKGQGFGTPAEIAMLSPRNRIGDERNGGRQEEFTVDNEAVIKKSSDHKPPTPAQMSRGIQKVIKDCGPGGLASMTGLPISLWEQHMTFSSTMCNRYMSVWRGNGIDPKTAMAGASTVEEMKGAIWYEIYMGLKGDLGPAWRPRCDSGSWKQFMSKFRPDEFNAIIRNQPSPDQRLGDFDDMIRIFRDIIKRDPEAREQAQKLFDHICVDEAQDLNVIQHEIFSIMADGMCGSKDRSFWVVGDDKQSIYSFRGARPSLFTDLVNKECWTKRLIQTNYRCEPEIVDAGNKIAAHNPDQIQMQCRAAPNKRRGKASIVVETPEDYIDGAASVLGDFEQSMALKGDKPSDYAVLSRTNAELDAFEDQCILREIPYTRSKKTSGFLNSRESKCVLGYLDLALSSDYEEMQAALANVVDKPNRGVFLPQEDLERIVKDAIKAAASAGGVDYRSFNPLDMLTRPAVARKFAQALKQPYLKTKIATAQAYERKVTNSGRSPVPGWLEAKYRNLGSRKYEWQWELDVDDLTNKLLELGEQVTKLRLSVRAGAKTSQVLDNILDNITSKTGFYNKKTGVNTEKTVSLREQIREDIATFADPEEGEGEDSVGRKLTVDADGRIVQDVTDGTDAVVEDPLKGLGTVRYLYQLVVPNEKDKALGVDPENGTDFYRKMDRYKSISKDLQDPKKNPHQMSLSTVHSVKGAQWTHVALCMSSGFFPVKRKEQQHGIDEELAKLNMPARKRPGFEEARAVLDSIQEDPMVAERNLAYVGVTRAKETLKIVCSQERVRPEERKLGPQVGQFVKEAGLGLGENVKTVPEGAQPEPTATGGAAGDNIPGPTDYNSPEPTDESVKLAYLDDDSDRYVPDEATTTYTYGR